MRDLWKSDLVYAMRVLSGIEGEPRAGVMRSRSVRKDIMSKSWSADMLIEELGGREEQSAAVMPLPIVTIEVQRLRVTSSLRGAFVRIGIMDFRMARAEVVA